MVATRNVVEAGLEPAVLRGLISARAVEGQALGFQVRLTDKDQAALSDFATRVGMSGERP